MADVGDPRAYMAAAIAILAEYPESVMDELADPVRGSKLLKDYPSIRDIRKACDQAYEPIARETERALSRQNYLRSLPPPREKRTPEEQAVVDEQVARWNRLRGRPRGDLNPRGLSRLPGDGKHGQRIAAELAARKAKKEEGCNA